jgi:two-component system, NtrC family, sensor kinase
VAANAYKYAADVTTELGDLPLVVCNGGDMNQVFLNLIVNAAHAIEDRVGDSGRRGTITIRTRRDGDNVVVSIADSGGGIPAEIARRIFDPFFTTKDVGRGTGQGLAIARTMVVERHAGTLTFDSEPGHGTTFHVGLPIAGLQLAGEQARAA